MIDPAAYEALTFDCYGTLVDWETGISTALGSLLQSHGVETTREEILELHAALELAAQGGEYRLYREVLARVVDGVGERYGFEPTADERLSLARSIADWPAFADTPEALRRLATRFRLAIVSNIDDALFEETASRLGVELDAVVTAEQVRSYKPSRAHFDTVIARLDLPRSAVLHVAQSLFHDVAPARALGFDTVWVNRRRGVRGPGATPPAEAVPDLEVATLDELAELLV